MNKKDNKKEEDTFTAGEVMSMLENVNDGIQIIAEQQGDVAKKLEKVEKGLDGVKERVGSLELKVDRIQDDITEIKYKLSEKVDRDEFKKLEKRVIKLERLGFAK
jgi:hypothetical protein